MKFATKREVFTTAKYDNPLAARNARARALWAEGFDVKCFMRDFSGLAPGIGYFVSYSVPIEEKL